MRHKLTNALFTRSDVATSRRISLIVRQFQQQLRALIPEDNPVPQARPEGRKA